LREAAPLPSSCKKGERSVKKEEERKRKTKRRT
jgi:hypothetical protein